MFNIFILSHLPYQPRTLSVSEGSTQPQLACGFQTQTNLSVALSSTTHRLRGPRQVHTPPNLGFLTESEYIF